MSWRHLEDVFITSWRRLEDALKRSWRRFKDVLKTSSKCLEDVLKTSWSRRLEDLLKTYGQDEYIGLNQDVLKTSSEDEDERRLHQDECLLGLLLTLNIFYNFFYCFYCSLLTGHHLLGMTVQIVIFMLISAFRTVSYHLLKKIKKTHRKMFSQTTCFL